MNDPICPFAAQRLLHGEEDRRAPITPTATALHTNGISATPAAIGDFFDGELVHTESHFDIGEHGELVQYMPVNRKANAQVAGNDHVVSTETWDGGNPATPLNALQLATLIRLYVWLFTEWAVTLDVSTSPSGPGAGWHSKYPTWNPNGHACPGPVRTRQLLDVVLPGARRLASNPQEDLVRNYIVVDVNPPDAKGLQIVGTPFKFGQVTAVTIKANDGGPPVRAIVEPFAFGDGCALSFVGLDGKPVPAGKVGVIVTTVA
jgi:hypothetical protein